MMMMIALGMTTVLISLAITRVILAVAGSGSLVVTLEVLIKDINEVVQGNNIFFYIIYVHA